MQPEIILCGGRRGPIKIKMNLRNSYTFPNDYIQIDFYNSITLPTGYNDIICLF